ncbi:MAG: hypothetical protein ACK4RK_16055 [Gemmataceae bacterium]
MLRKMLFSLFLMLVCVGLIIADEIKGTVAKVDAEKGVISVKVEGKEKPINVKVGKKVKLAGVADVKDIKEGAKVTIVREEKKVTEIKVE